MDARHLSRAQFALTQAMDPTALMRLARSSGFCRRMRSIFPHEVAVAVVTCMATQKTETIADVLRVFNALTGHNSAYKPFHKKLSKPEFPDFMRMVVGHLLDKLVGDALRPAGHSSLSLFDDILLQDGTSFAIADVLRDVFPGRRTTLSPAAVELHATMSVWSDQPVSLSVAPDTEAERNYRPMPSELRNCLLIADRGYQDIDYCREVHSHGGYVLIRHQTAINPAIIDSFADGHSVPAHRGRRLHDIVGKRRHQTFDVDAQWKGVGRKSRPDTKLRVVLLWNDKRCEYLALVTNLDRKQFPPDVLMKLYRLRWQVELLFKEWKSYCNLHAFTTSKAPIAEGFMWAALAACILKRFIAKATQRVFGHAEISTRKTAMTIGHHLFALCEAILEARGVRDALRQAMHHLNTQARRAHPKRDRRSGRLTLGIEPVLA